MQRDTTGIRRACELAKGQASLARLLIVSAPTVSEWVNGERPLPPKRAVQIEKMLGVRRWELLPADWWEHWPELIGADGAPAPVAATAQEAA